MLTADIDSLSFKFTIGLYQINIIMTADEQEGQRKRRPATKNSYWRV
ncbi:hypothetical protein HMPREF1565_2449 [Providencia alcalifaciens RIMD 1656011]|uniref:Uncharacterized protein n=1 Tax=Providencia alcalifaciens 205/92 TaxID=1256988 RepID=A0AAV3M2E2_9GAMM|nr:hypothetical protein HMPREF1565_2449 [Providencia alcalifaciens RIMD 1656011]EUD09876.1 hypothetical protein HMPREF1563_0548 [Providencia alcalifaciens 205/92]